jgi:hypothetical protein
MLCEVLADVSVKFAFSGIVIPCSFVRCYKRLGETRIPYLEYLIMFRTNLFHKPKSEGSILNRLRSYLQNHTASYSREQ